MTAKNNLRNSMIQLSDAQLFMLKMSDDDIENGRLISLDDLDRMDREWLKTI